MSGWNDRRETSNSPSRRDLLGTLGAAGAVSIAGCGMFGGDDGQAESGGEDDTVRIGLSIPEEGRWQNEGEQLKDGYLLAVRHINNGTGPMAPEGDYEPPLGRIEGGLLDRTVELEVRNSESTASGARSSAQALIGEDIAMFAGGGSPAEGVAHQEVAAETETLYMGGFTPTDAVGGAACSRYGFNEVHNQRMAADALATALTAEFGEDADITFAQLRPDNDFGDGMASAVQSSFAAAGWSQNVTESTRVGTGSFSGAIGDVLDTGPDLLVLNYTGLAAAIALRDFAALDESETEVVVPILTDETLKNARSGLTGAFGTVPWTAELDDSFSQQFVESWDSTETELESPSGLAHLAYVQLYQYGAAVERAGTLDTEAVIDELEGTEYDVGLGSAALRACDHQATRSVPVVRGLPEPQQAPGNYVQLVDLIDASYPCEEQPAADCQL